MGMALFTAAAVGCAATEASQAVDTSKPVVMTSPPDYDDASAFGALPAPPQAPVLGSPLCNATYSTCFPDDPKTAHANWCLLAPDGGVYSAAAPYDNAQLACHVQPAFNAAGVAPQCTLAGTLTDVSSRPCGAPTDCASGFECILGGTCRHYCCGGECFDPTEFCDIQQTVGSPSIKVPVCMPVHGCGLLDQPSDAGACLPGQTCAVVRVDNGATSCVKVGSSNAGDECDKEHCASGLVCLGTPGDRHCYKLCHTAPGSADCAASRQTCKGGLPLFPLPGIGICE
jgi:hypothetical protein